MMRNFFIVFCVLSLAATCQKQKTTTEDNPCEADIICTREFRVVKLQILEKDGTPVQLDSYYTRFEESKVTIDSKFSQVEEGFYPVATDAEMESIEFEGTKVRFIGVKSGKTVVKHDFILGKDCCHISLLKGEEKITL